MTFRGWRITSAFEFHEFLFDPMIVCLYKSPLAAIFTFMRVEGSYKLSRSYQHNLAHAYPRPISTAQIETKEIATTYTMPPVDQESLKKKLADLQELQKKIEKILPREPDQAAKATVEQNSATVENAPILGPPSISPGRHKLQKLADLIVANSKNQGTNLTTLQQKALKDYETAKTLALGTSTEKLAELYEPIFDNLFFLGTLKGRVKVTASGKPSKKVYGYARTDSKYPDRAKIVVNTLYDDGYGRIIKHVATLLHEMIHAFLLIYMARTYYWLPARFNNGRGYTGHGSAWHDIAYALEQAVTRLMGVNLEMGREISMWTELQKAKWRGEKIDPSKWGLSGNKYGRPGKIACSTFNPAGQPDEGRNGVQGGNGPFDIFVMGPAGWQSFKIPDLPGLFRTGGFRLFPGFV